MRLMILMATLSMVGCDIAPSMQPLYTSQDSTFDASLLGQWKAADGDARLICTRLDDTGYRVFYEEQGVAAFTGRLVQLDQARFVDLYPEQPGMSNGFYAAHLIRAHTFARIWLAGDDLKIGSLDPEWFKTGEGSQAVLGRIGTEDQPVISAATSDLRFFAARYADTPAFGAVTEWKREPAK